MRPVARVILIATLALTASSLPSNAEKKPKAPPPEPTHVTMKATVPSLAPLEGSEANQLRNGIRISLQLEDFHPEFGLTQSKQQVAPPSKWGLVLMPDPKAIYVETTQAPIVSVKPDHLVFHLHISNQLPRVFRGSGILVQFNIAGKLVNVDPSGYGDLTNVLIPPRGEQEVTIVGPEIKDVPSPGTVGVFLYDVVTKLDQAGNITEKTNFEWYYSYQSQQVEQNMTIPPPSQGWEIPN